ncbi:MAG: hypothetical protein WBX15_09430 [Thermoanaerobaculia bacterium]
MTSAESASEFEDQFDQLNESIGAAHADFGVRGELQKVFVQFQYDCEKLPNSVRGTKVGRYSKKEKHIEGYIQVDRRQFDRADEIERQRILVVDLIRILEEIQSSLSGKVENDIAESISRVRRLQFSLPPTS